MKKALMTLAIAAVGIATLGSANPAQAGVSITFSSDAPVYHPRPRVYHPAPVVVYPEHYRRVRKVHYGRAGRTVEYRYDRRERYDDYHSRDHRRNDDCDDDNNDDRYYRH